VILDQLNELWNSLIEFTEQFVIPDWGALVDLLPVFLLIGVVGPILTLLALFWLRYLIVRPRVEAEWVEQRRPAPLDGQGQPVFPTGEPYSLSEQMIYEPGATRSSTGETLLVACPRCELVRAAEIDVCGNCGLSFTITPPTRTIRAAAPPPGGRAAV
jgi:hypothetical protein